MMVRTPLMIALAGAMLLGASPTLQPTSDPAILNVSVSPVPVRVGAPVTTTVTTTTDVVSVQGHVATFTFNIPKTGDGSFSGTTTVPRWTRLFFHGNYNVRFIAKTAAGAQTETVQSVQI